MTYRTLDTETVIDYIKSRPAMESVFVKGAPLEAEEVGDGNLNLVLSSGTEMTTNSRPLSNKPCPIFELWAKSWPLTRERMRFETQALLFYNNITPGLVPHVYDHDEEMSMVVMEYLGDHEVMRKPLVERKRFPLFVDHISTFLARSLFFTSDLYLTGLEKKELQAKFINPHMCKIQEDFVFTNPYMVSPENKWNPVIDAEVGAVRQNGALKIAIAEMKESYMTHGQALIHSDLHTGSIMLNEDDTRVIDPEFAFFGPMGFDIGALLENLVLNYLSHFAETPDRRLRDEYQAYLLDMLCETWRSFARKFDVLWQENNHGELVPENYWEFSGGQEAFAEFRRRYIQDLLQDTIGHGGCKMLRRMMGIVSVWDITSIEDLEKRAIVERLAIKIGSRWVIERKQIDRIEDLVEMIREEAPSNLI